MKSLILIIFLDDSLSAPHFLYKHEDLISNHTCGYKNEYDSNIEIPKSHYIPRVKKEFILFALY